jgi:adenine C2-methylase RlmN of 23S rRNA A2503 and tRNA A37
MGGHRYNLSTMNAAEFLPDVRAVLEERNEPSYRIRQIYKALTGSLVRDWREATNLPRGLQAALSEGAPAAALALERVSQATDGTRKYLFHTRDGHAIETVMIPEKARRTVCISTQVGCTFCATGLLGIKRNLKTREIAEQVFVCARDSTTTRRKLFFEYTLLAGVNDQPRHVEALAVLLDHPLYHLNLLRFNWTDTGFSATSKAEAKRFLGHARELGLSATLRPSRGQDIDAACGQLAAKDLRGRPAVPMV